MKKFFHIRKCNRRTSDKLCDFISDSILDAYLEKDENSRVACETVAKRRRSNCNRRNYFNSRKH